MRAGMSRRTLSAAVYPHGYRALALAVLLGAAALALLFAQPASAHHVNRPHMPQSVRVVATTASTVAISWRRTAARSALARNYRSVGVTRRTRWVFRNLECDRTYRLAVRALDRQGRRSRAAIRFARSLPCDSPPPPGPPMSVTAPQVTGVARAGRVLHANQGTWNGTLPLSYAFQWQRCDAAASGCTDVPGATGTNHLLGEADVGSTMRAQVTATNTEGPASAASAPTALVSAPGGSGSCSRADATGCAAVAGSRISLLNQRFSCDRPLADVAAQNPIGDGPGRLPLLVEVGFTTFVALDPAVIELKAGCVGDGDDETIDLVVQVEGDGRTIGGTSDAVKVRLSARDVQLTGFANCGPRGLGADGRADTADDSHQDGAQIQGGDTVEFIDFEWGDWETNTATCQGAAGIFVPASVNGNPVTGMACIRCKSVSCNHGMHFGASFGSLSVDSMWRTGNPADRTVVLANGQIGLCRYSSPPCTMGEGEPQSYTILRNYCDRWPYGDGE
jgi:hypothetical protein